jgi:hypothetical protein
LHHGGFLSNRNSINRASSKCRRKTTSCGQEIRSEKYGYPPENVEDNSAMRHIVSIMMDKKQTFK